MENKKLTTEEIEKIQLIQQKNNLIVNELGSIELVKLQIEKRRTEALSFLTSLREEEQAFGKELSEKYGDGTVDIEKGEFISIPSETI
jgi:hypothetical protein